MYTSQSYGHVALHVIGKERYEHDRQLNKL